MSEIVIVGLILGAILVYLIATHKISTAGITAEFASIKDKLGLVHAAVLAPVTVTVVPAVASNATTVAADTTKVAAPAPSTLTPLVASYLGKTDATDAILNARVGDGAPIAPTGPFDLWTGQNWFHPNLQGSDSLNFTVPDSFSGHVEVIMSGAAAGTVSANITMNGIMVYGPSAVPNGVFNATPGVYTITLNGNGHVDTKLNHA